MPTDPIPDQAAEELIERLLDRAKNGLVKVDGRRLRIPQRHVEELQAAAALIQIAALQRNPGISMEEAAAIASRNYDEVVALREKVAGLERGANDVFKERAWKAEAQVAALQQENTELRRNPGITLDEAAAIASRNLDEARTSRAANDVFKERAWKAEAALEELRLATVDGRLAELFHGYETRPESAVPWDKVPPQNRSLMVAATAAAFKALDRALSPLQAEEQK
jgi:hypothetical protein